jgi:acetyl-CoA carboxylase carboxyl transferase subunit alpha
MDNRAEFSELSVAVASGPNGTGCLEFEKPLAELESQIAELQVLHQTKGINYTPEIRELRRNLVQLTQKVYSHLTAWETVQVARHPRRPILGDYLNSLVQDFCELHGDRQFGDDKAMVTGFGRIGREKVMIVGHNKGRDTKEKVACNFGCAQPEGYRKALVKMQLAEKFHLPIICLIDTPGAYPGIGAEERGQSQAIAYNLMQMSRLRVPIVCVIIGEGGSGGALGIGVGDRLAMMQFAWYSVISPEGCAAILWKDGSKAAQAAEALKLTSKELMKLGVIDHIIDEPLGGAHRNPHEAVQNMETFLVKSIRDLKRFKMENLLENRYRNLRRIGEMSLESPEKRVSATTNIMPVGQTKEVSVARKENSKPFVQ